MHSKCVCELKISLELSHLHLCIYLYIDQFVYIILNLCWFIPYYYVSLGWVLVLLLVLDLKQS